MNALILSAPILMIALIVMVIIGVRKDLKSGKHYFDVPPSPKNDSNTPYHHKATIRTKLTCASLGGLILLIVFLQYAFIPGFSTMISYSASIGRGVGGLVAVGAGLILYALLA